MSQISVKIEYANAKRPRTPVKVEYAHPRSYFVVPTMLFAALFVGVSLGVASYERILPLSFFSGNTGEQLGAVGATDAVETGDASNLNTEIAPSIPRSEEPSPPPSSAGEILGVTAPSQNDIAAENAAIALREKERGDLEAEIADLKATIVRTNTEIERTVKDSSAQVALFYQNCGIWEDECATPYHNALEENNASYNALLKDLTAATRALERAEERWSELLP